MTDKLDRDIRRALQSGPHDLTFTPEMRRRVLQRIQAEEAGPDAPAVKTGRSPRSRAIPRPLRWMAVAAAALLLAFRLDQGGDGGRQTAMELAPKADSAVPAQSRAQPAPAEAPAQTPAPPPKGEAPAATPPRPEVTTTDAGGAPVNAMAPHATAQHPKPAVLHLAAAAVASTMNAHADQVAAQTLAPRGITSFAKVRPTIRLALRPAADHVIELNTAGLRAVRPDGSEIWNTPIPELGPKARLITAPDGRLAVISGKTVFIVTADGVLDQSITLADPVTDAAFSPDGRVALAFGTQVDVRKGDASQFQVATGSPAYVAFAPNGTLATLYTKGDRTYLSLRDAAGQHAVDVTAPSGAHVLAVGGNNLVLAGSQAYDLKGAALWALPFNPEGISRLGDLLVAWDEKQAVCVDANGATLWNTALDTEGLTLRKVVPASDGRSLVILGSTPSGGAVWVAAATGELLSSQGTAVAAVDAALIGDHLAILTLESLSFTK